MSTLAPSRPDLHIPRPVFVEATPEATEPNKQHLLLLLLFWLAIFVTSLASPPLLDDADATHAQAAQAMLHTGDWVTLHVDGVRYLEKAPLPYWIAALSLRLFGENAFAIHLPLALAVLGLAALGYRWALRSFDPRTAFYTALFVLTSIGPFLFTRIFIPDALLSLLLGLGLYALHRTLGPDSPAHATVATIPGAPGPDFRTRIPTDAGRFALLFWLALALAVLTKGLIAIVFLLGSAVLYLTLTTSWHRWRRIRPLAGALLFLVIAAPWHVLAGLRNAGRAGGHGFFWFYFVNEHFLRFLGRRIPRDYNKLPGLLYWLLHIVWLFPWSFFAPVAAALLWRKRHSLFAATSPAQQTFVLLAGFSALVLVFFSFSTNQEYYTFPVYLPLLMLLAAALRRAQLDSTPQLARVLRVSYAALGITGLLLASALAFGLWRAHALSSLTDLESSLDHRGIGGYTLSLSHFFDLTGASFASLRLPAALALAALALGPAAAWLLQRKHAEHSAVLVLATASGVFLFAAHIALVRFTPVLSSRAFADRILLLEHTHQIAPNADVLILGDQAFGSSIPFYLRRPVQLVDGRSTSMLFGSFFPDVPPVFISRTELQANWGHGARKLLFVPAEQRSFADEILGPHPILLFQSSGKELLTDRPLDPPSIPTQPNDPAR